MTAKDFFYDSKDDLRIEDDNEMKNLISLMNSYAKFHVKRALEAVCENVTGKPSYDYSNRYKIELIEDSVDINEESILNAYNLDNIK